MQASNRKSSFKTPPIERDLSQRTRRAKALEEQKRKRAQCVDFSRDLDNFERFSLGPDDSEPEDGPQVLREGVAHLSSLLSSQSNDPKKLALPHPFTVAKPRKVRKPDPHFANRIMYAELLEMKNDQMFVVGQHGTPDESDGLPDDLATNWVALAPVPQGKRCLAVSNQSVNVSGMAPNTYLKSRLKGHTILRFPSPLPPATILDCILDVNWKSNGLLHVLDVVRWKGQEVGECETTFRFWWRDTRLSELVFLPPQINVSHASPPSGLTTSSSYASGHISPQVLSYPTVFLPVPYHMKLSLPTLLSTVIPLSRSGRSVTIQTPSPTKSLPPSKLYDDMEDMEVDHDPGVQLEPATVEIQSDGLLLYVSQASYEPGRSPLSSWVPVKSSNETHESPLALFERLVERRVCSLLHVQTTSDDYKFSQAIERIRSL